MKETDKYVTLVDNTFLISIGTFGSRLLTFFMMRFYTEDVYKRQVGYIAMRAFGWTDAFLETDLGVKKGLAPRSRKEMLELAESWRPWRAYAVMCIWNASE